MRWFIAVHVRKERVTDKRDEGWLELPQCMAPPIWPISLSTELILLPIRFMVQPRGAVDPLPAVRRRTDAFGAAVEGASILVG